MQKKDKLISIIFSTIFNKVERSFPASSGSGLHLQTCDPGLPQSQAPVIGWYQ